VGGEGTIAAMSLHQHLVQAPVLLTVRDGRLESATGDSGAAFLAHLDVHGPLGRNLAELGIGTNDRATLTGNEDVVVLEPSLWIGATQVLDAGRYLLG